MRADAGEVFKIKMVGKRLQMIFDISLVKIVFWCLNYSEGELKIETITKQGVLEKIK